MLPIEELEEGVALTFDDGPHPVWTPQMIEALVAIGAPATFFVLGTHLEAEPWVLELLLDHGMSVGVHGWDHVDLTGRSPDFLDDQLGRAADSMRRLGVMPTVFRPPFGWYDDGVIDAAGRLGLRTVLWSIDPQDWKATSAGAIINHVNEGLRPGAIVLLHDGGGESRAPTVAAVPSIAAAAAASGLVLVDVAAQMG